MRCERMHATIRVAQCLANQKNLISGEHYYPGCNGCETGALARNGVLSDDDIEARIEALGAERQREHVRMRTSVTRKEVVETVEAAPERADMDESQQKKRCSKCGEWKSRSEFNKDRKARDGLLSRCKECKRLYEKGWRKSRKTQALRDAVPASGATQGRCVPGEIATEGIPEHVLVLDFSEHREALEKLKELARAEFRTPGAQLMYWFLRGKIAG